MIEDLKQNTLIIPQGLSNHKDVKQIFKYDNNSTILYKCMDFNLINLEFYTQTHCIVFACNGVETITAYDFSSVDIKRNELLFLPKDMYLISDFIKTNKSLEAYLFFFDDEIIDKFLSSKELSTISYDKKVNFYKINTNESINNYIESLKSVSKDQFDSKHFLELKLLELLHLASTTDDRVIDSLRTKNKDKNKRNIKLLMKKYYLSNFNMEDYALLSGRSLSTFHREFKMYNNITPKKYLLNLKLEHAKELVLNSNKTVSQIASDIGYENVSHFIKAFKVKYKNTPKQLSKISS